MGDEQLIMGHSKGASYGNNLDNIIKEYADKTKQEVITGEESEIRQVKMIQVGRIDWIIWDPLALELLLKKEGMQKNYGVYEIHEKEDTFIYAHIAVPKNEWGKKMINRINLILKQSIPTDEFYNGLAEWVPDELKASFRKGYEELLIQPAMAYEPED